MYDQVTHAPLEHFIRRLIRPHYLELGWRDEGTHVVRSVAVWSAPLPGARLERRGLAREQVSSRLIRPHYLELGWRDEGSHVIRSVAAAVGMVR